MARAAKKRQNEYNAQKFVFELAISIAGFLAAIGKPVYFVVEHIIIALTFLFYGLSETVISLFRGNLKPKKQRKKPAKRKKSRKKRGKFKFIKFKIPPLFIPDIFKVLRLEELKISLLGIKFLTFFKRLVDRTISRLQKYKLKIRIRVLIVLLLLSAICLYSYINIFKDLPSPSELTQKAPQVSTKIYDRNGILLYKIYKDQNRTIVPLSDIPVHVRLATLSAEDAEFYDHPGFSLRGISRAIIQDLQTGSLQGGSTITQQLVKNILLTPEKTITRKIKELVLSVEVEATYTKDQIFELYLNQVNYGGTSYGIQEASREFFGKDVEDLDLSEAAFLAGLPKSPTSYSPYGPNPELGLQRQREVLHLMVINKFITAEQEEQAVSKRLVFKSNKNGIKAPHFVMYIKQLLVDKYGEDMVQKGGLEVTTSLDLAIQEMAEKVVKEEVDKLKGLNVKNGDALVINPQTGEILAMVGSTDYYNTGNDGQVNVTLRLRQPGSSIKVVNYAYALSHGYTPATIINDSPITYSIPGSPPYSPVNYDGQFRGNISLRSALAQSRNIPAVKVLASYGVSKMVEMGKKMGITSWDDPSKFGLSLTLGGGAVTALDLSKVYSTIANGGNLPIILPILQIKDYKGKVLERNSPQSSPVLDPKVAFILTDILKDNVARSPEFGLNSYLVVKDHPEVAVKTGTSNDLRDNWTAGFNQNFLVVTWVGNNNNAPMSRVASGITGASPIWNKIMSALLLNQASIDWGIPPGVSKINICSLTGTLPCGSCPTRQEWFMDENRPTKACVPDQIEKLIKPGQTLSPKEKILNGASSTNRRPR